MGLFCGNLPGEAHPCDGGNCLPTLQMQLAVVFTGKTIGKQVIDITSSRPPEQSLQLLSVYMYLIATGHVGGRNDCRLPD